MKTFIDIFKTIMLATALAVSVGSCSDDIDYRGNVVPDGEDAKLTLKVSVTEATHLSRATSDSYVKSLWIGIYNAKSKACTFNQTFEENKDAGSHIPQTLSLDCKSGESYIVAVANYDEFIGHDMNTNAEKPLSEMLAAADTWDSYCAIAIQQNMSSGDNDLSVAEPSGELIMSGTYDEADHSATLPSNIKPVAIQAGSSTLKGAIHLRRLWTENTLKISAEGDIINMELQNIEVFNVPKYSWIQDRQLADAGIIADNIAVVNAGDMVDSSPLDNSAYLSSMRFTPPSEIQVSNGVYTFKFWQFENKRTGTATTYEDREREVKDGNEKNTGIFTSLCATSQGDVNNNATYVKINATITYKNPQSMVNPDDVTTGDNAGELPESAASRTAEVTYIVHLGYIGNDPTDFNCYRNSKYTYNITAQSVNKILVEAFNGDEKQPGAEGTVTDVTDKIENLDAHTGVFNIFLTTEQVRSFTFSMRTYVKGQPTNFYYNDATDHNIPDENDPDFKYYNWIEFVPTGLDLGRSDNNKTDANERVFAPFPNIVNGRTGVEVYYPHELPKSGLQGQWFTVYVNEYTYEKRYGEAGYGNEKGEVWKEYVNQPNRQAWFNVAQEISPDGHSVYFKSKYALTQKSIQTYYNIDASDCETALGVEHENEVFGMNLRWTIDPANADPDNGRWNVWNLGIGGAGKEWKSFVNFKSSLYVRPINNTSQANYQINLFNTAEKYLPLPMPMLIPRNNLNGTNLEHYKRRAEIYDPQSTDNVSTQYLEALQGCLNRNRDENGNGIIDPEELKWYLPASGKYVRVILGRSTLSSPLMDYAQPTLPIACTTGGNTLYHFISSDNVIVWVDEGMSSSSFYGEFNKDNHKYSISPWQLRCIRNLGTNLTNVTSGEKVTPAYDDKDKNTTTRGGVVKVTHYYGTAVREPVTSPIPLHKTSMNENKLGRYGFEYAPSGNVFNGAFTTEATVSYTQFSAYKSAVENATPCASLNATSGRGGWRIPNQKELVIMRRAGAFTDVSSTQTQFMGCTQEHWSHNDNSGPAYSTGTTENQHRIVTVRKGLATAQPITAITLVRCVRDLTAAEAGKTYEQIVNNR